MLPSPPSTVHRASPTRSPRTIDDRDHDETGRQSTRLEPETAWTVVTDSPLKGLALAREAGTILAWDEGNQLYLLNAQGESLSYLAACRTGSRPARSATKGA